jgi:ribosomal protein S14
LAHAASLRQTFYFARLKFREFLHSFPGVEVTRHV